MSRTSKFAEDCAIRRERHLAVGRSRKGSHIVYPVVGQPGLRRGADLPLPNVALRLLVQSHMRATSAGARELCTRRAPGEVVTAAMSSRGR